MSKSISVELPDGQSVEFPAGTPTDVMENALVNFYKEQQSYSPEVPVIPPQGSSFTPSAPKDPWESFKRDLPANVGGILYPLLGAKMGLLGRIGLAGLGGATGEAGQKIYEGFSGKQQTPAGVAADIGKAGGREAAFEGASGAVLKGVDALRQGLTPSITEGGGRLVSKFREYGGRITAPQISDSWALKQLEGLSRGSVTGSGVFSKVAQQSDEAYSVYAKSLPTEVATKAKEVLSDQEIGELFMNTVGGGRAAHSKAAGFMYEALDQLTAPVASTRTVNEVINTGLVDNAGKAITRTAPKQVETLTGGHLVSMGGLKDIATEYAERYKRIANVGAGKVSREVISKLQKIGDTVYFKDAHNLRSELLAMQREIQQDVGAGKAKAMLHKLVGAIEKEMSTTANKAGGDILKGYQQADTFWKKGKSIFDDKFIADLAMSGKKTAESIGDILFRDGRATEIMKARKAIKAASQMTGKGNSQEIWHSMQAGYLEKLLTQNLTKDGTVNSSMILKRFTDRRKNRTLNAAFTKAQRDKIVEFAAIGQRIQAKPEGGLGMVMNLTQAGTIAGIVALDVANIVSPETAAVLAAPRVVAYMLTRPKLVDKMIRAAKTPAGSQRGIKLGKELANSLNKVALQFIEREANQ